MTKKMKKQGGFTLVEMLIVVAIIAILIAVSIPLVTNALEKAREATDAANERAFKAVLVTGYLLDTEGMSVSSGGVAIEADTEYVFDAVNGVAKATGDASSINAYGQSDKTKGNSEVVAKGQILHGKIDSDGTVSMGWGSLDNKLVSNDLVKTTAPAAGG